MTVQLTKSQIDAIKVELAQYGLNVTVARKTVGKAKTVGEVLAKSKWYKRPSLAALGKRQNPKYFRFVEARYRFDKMTGTYHAII